MQIPALCLPNPFGEALDAAGSTSGDVVVTSWGRAVYSVSRTIRRTLPGVVIAPAMGGNASDRPWFQPNEIVRTWAHAFGGRPVYLNAPALVSAPLAEPLRAEPEIHDVVRLWDQAKVALIGVGAWPKPDPSYAAAGFPVDDPALADAVGDVAGWSFTIDGEIVRHQDARVLLGRHASPAARDPARHRFRRRCLEGTGGDRGRARRAHQRPSHRHRYGEGDGGPPELRGRDAKPTLKPPWLRLLRWNQDSGRRPAMAAARPRSDTDRRP